MSLLSYSWKYRSALKDSVTNLSLKNYTHTYMCIYCFNSSSKACFPPPTHQSQQLSATYHQSHLWGALKCWFLSSTPRCELGRIPWVLRVQEPFILWRYLVFYIACGNHYSKQYMCALYRGREAQLGKVLKLGRSLFQRCAPWVIRPLMTSIQHFAIGATGAIEAMCLWGNLVICCSIFLQNLKKVLV